jgi:hypothetical protein
MKKITKIIILLALAVVTAKAEMPPIDSVYAKYAEFTGIEKIKSTDTWKMEANLQVGQLEFNFDYHYMRPDFYRYDSFFRGMKEIRVMGKQGAYLKYGGMLDTMRPEIVRQTVMPSTFINGPFFDYGNEGFKYEVSGDTTENSVNYWVVTETDTNGFLTDIYVNKTDYSVYKIERIEQTMEIDMLNIYYFEDYQEFDGMKIPMKIEVYTDQESLYFKINSVTPGIRLNSFDFRRPTY